jgi:hypothetical protein
MVNHDDLTGLELGHEGMCHPGVEDRGGAIACKTARTKELVTAQRGNCRDATGAVAGLSP